MSKALTRKELDLLIESGEDVSQANVSEITDFSELFKDNTTFNQDISKWDVSKGKHFGHMFCNAQSFNQDIGNWDVSSGEIFNSVFVDAYSFNQNINNWDISNGESFYYMFCNAMRFNQPLNKWNVSKSKNLAYIFCNAQSFNQDISKWDVSNVENFQSVFEDAKSFNQDLNNWDLSSGKFFSYMFKGTDFIRQTSIDWVFNENTSIKIIKIILEELNYKYIEGTIISGVEEEEYIIFLNKEELVLKIENRNGYLTEKELIGLDLKIKVWDQTKLVVDMFDFGEVSIDTSTELYQLFQLKYADTHTALDSDKFYIHQNMVYDYKLNEIYPDEFEVGDEAFTDLILDQHTENRTI